MAKPIEDVVAMARGLSSEILRYDLNQDQAKKLAETKYAEFNGKYGRVVDLMAIRYYREDIFVEFLEWLAREYAEAKKKETSDLKTIVDDQELIFVYPAFLNRAVDKTMTRKKFAELREKYKQTYRKGKEQFKINVEKSKERMEKYNIEKEKQLKADLIRLVKK